MNAFLELAAVVSILAICEVQLLNWIQILKDDQQSIQQIYKRSPKP